MKLRARVSPESRAAPVKIRARVWLETRGAPLLTDAGADLLEQIHACGSLSTAARRLGFSYRRAWMLVDAMNRRWPRPLVRKTTGGTRGGGSALTESGFAALSAYRDLQVSVEALLDREEQRIRAHLIGM